MVEPSEQRHDLTQVLTQFADKLMEIFDEFARANTENKNEYLREQTYRPTNFFITLNVAILSASSFFFSRTDQINLLSKLLYIGISLAFVSIILEIFNRKDYLRIIDLDATKRVINADSRRKELGEIMKQFHAKGFLETYNALMPLTQTLDDTNKLIETETTKMLLPVHRRRNVAMVCMIAALISLFSVGLSQLGVFRWILQQLLRTT
ncbi:MAG: hypothetical protein WCV62_01225 [Candidatus Peribacteraceae bacterium]|jgi:hypothetical protein